MLSGKAKEELIDYILTYLRSKAEEINKGVDPKKYVITKALSKPPEQYPDKNSQPHVKVALKLKELGKPVKTGEHIEYIICEGASESFADRACAAENVMKPGASEKIDIKWYLSQVKMRIPKKTPSF